MVIEVYSITNSNISRIYENLVTTKQIKPADYVKIDVATEVSV